jgi:hypothetical protein
MLLLELAVGFVDRIDQLGEAGRVVHGPESRETVAQQLDFALGKQSDSDDALFRQGRAPN